LDKHNGNDSPQSPHTLDVFPRVRIFLSFRRSESSYDDIISR